MLLATAMTVLRMEIPIMIREVWMTTVWLCLFDALVDDALDQERDGQVHEDQRGQQNQRQGGASPVWFDKGEEFFNLGQHVIKSAAKYLQNYPGKVLARISIAQVSVSNSCSVNEAI